MLEPLEEANQGKNMQMDKHDDYVYILDSINLDMEDTLDDEHVSSDEKLINMDYDLPNMLSMQLTITPTNEHSDSQSPCLQLIVILTIMDVVPLTSHHPSPGVAHAEHLMWNSSIMVVFVFLCFVFPHIVFLFYVFYCFI